jgi:multidrug efflux pump subunit AcrB
MISLAMGVGTLPVVPGIISVEERFRSLTDIVVFGGLMTSTVMSL